jgi:hypothetical protein
MAGGVLADAQNVPLTQPNGVMDPGGQYVPSGHGTKVLPSGHAYPVRQVNGSAVRSGQKVDFTHESGKDDCGGQNVPAGHVIG